MPGKMSAEWWREYRSKNRDRINAQAAARRKQKPRVRNRAEEYAKKRKPPEIPLEPLFPQIRHGGAISFWDEELNMDLAQEAELAKLQGRDPVVACRAYRAREYRWFRITAPLVELDGA